MTQKSAFSAAASAPKKSPAPAPFCVRLSAAEKARLISAANGQPLGAYVRGKLLGEAVQPRKTGRQRRKSDINDALLSKVLAALGASRLSSNLNQIARGANMGTLPLIPDVTLEIQEACTAVAGMRQDLLIALGHKSGGAP